MATIFSRRRAHRVAASHHARGRPAQVQSEVGNWVGRASVALARLARTCACMSRWNILGGRREGRQEDAVDKSTDWKRTTDSRDRTRLAAGPRREDLESQLLHSVVWKPHSCPSNSPAEAQNMGAICTFGCGEANLRPSMAELRTTLTDFGPHLVGIGRFDARFELSVGRFRVKVARIRATFGRPCLVDSGSSWPTLAPILRMSGLVAAEFGPVSAEFARFDASARFGPPRANQGLQSKSLRCPRS